MISIHSNASKKDIISKIRLEGNARVESQAIFNLIESKEGSTLDLEQVTKDVRKLYDLGFFSDIKVYKNKEKDNLNLLFLLVEKPAITKIQFEGLEQLKEEDLSVEVIFKYFHWSWPEGTEL